MRWQDQAVQNLRKYNQQKQSIENIPERIQALRASFEAVRCVQTDTVSVDGGGQGPEGAMLDNIVERKCLAHTLVANRKMVKLVERGLASLTEEERIVLDAFFINPPADKMEYLTEKLGYERSQIYRVKENALYKFTISQYGIPEY